LKESANHIYLVKMI